MKKIPTLFERDPENMARLTSEVHRDCHWVFDGEGVATRKYDGICVMFDGWAWWARREVKPFKVVPPGFVLEEFTPSTGKSVGWEPLERSGFAKWHAEALPAGVTCAAGTYELVGPKINGNPERFDSHALVPHAYAERYPALDVPMSDDGLPMGYDELARLFETLQWEGIVWHHPDGRMAKLKVRDFGRRR